MSRKHSQGFTPIIVVLIIVLVASAGFAVNNQKRNMLTSSQGVLGKDDVSNDSGNSGSSGSGSENSGKGSESSGSNSTGNIEHSAIETQKPETNSKSNETSKTVVKTESVKKTEKKLSSPKPLKTPEIEDEFHLETETENESETNLEVNDVAEDNVKKVSVKSLDNQFELEQEGSVLKVKSALPLSVSSETNEITITTPNGEKNINVLPQVAVDDVFASGVISSAEKVELQTEDDGSVVYNVDGSDTKKLFGFIKIKIPKTIKVSVDSGLVVGIEQSFSSKLLNLLSSQQ